MLTFLFIVSATGFIAWLKSLYPPPPQETEDDKQRRLDRELQLRDLRYPRQDAMNLDIYKDANRKD